MGNRYRHYIGSQSGPLLVKLKMKELGLDLTDEQALIVAQKLWEDTRKGIMPDGELREIALSVLKGV